MTSWSYNAAISVIKSHEKLAADAQEAIYYLMARRYRTLSEAVQSDIEPVMEYFNKLEVYNKDERLKLLCRNG